MIRPFLNVQTFGFPSARVGAASTRRRGRFPRREFTQACANAYANCTCLEMTSTDHMTISDKSETAVQFGEAGCWLADAIATYAKPRLVHAPPTSSLQACSLGVPDLLSRALGWACRAREKVWDSEATKPVYPGSRSKSRPDNRLDTSLLEVMINIQAFLAKAQLPCLANHVTVSLHVIVDLLSNGMRRWHRFSIKSRIWETNIESQKETYSFILLVRCQNPWVFESMGFFWRTNINVWGENGALCPNGVPDWVFTATSPDTT